jgi:hypothetical protein
MVAIQYSWLNRLRAYFQHRSRADEVQNPAYQAGIPGNGQPFPDGARMAKVHPESHRFHAIFRARKLRYAAARVLTSNA